MSKTTTKAKNQRLIEASRKVAYRIVTRKTGNGRVAVDQIRPYIESKFGDVWGPWAAHILPGDERFVSVGAKNTTTKASHGRAINLYRLA